jgi:hypothetical protein
MIAIKGTKPLFWRSGFSENPVFKVGVDFLNVQPLRLR